MPRYCYCFIIITTTIMITIIINNVATVIVILIIISILFVVAFIQDVYIYIHEIGYGGLVVSMLASGTQVCGCKPGRSRWIFRT